MKEEIGFPQTEYRAQCLFPAYIWTCKFKLFIHKLALIVAYLSYKRIFFFNRNCGGEFWHKNDWEISCNTQENCYFQLIDRFFSNSTIWDSSIHHIFETYHAWKSFFEPTSLETPNSTKKSLGFPAPESCAILPVELLPVELLPASVRCHCTFEWAWYVGYFFLK